MVTYEQIEQELKNGLGNCYAGDAEMAFNSAIRKSLIVIKRLFDNDNQKNSDFIEKYANPSAKPDDLLNAFFDSPLKWNIKQGQSSFVYPNFPTPNYNVSQSERFGLLTESDIYDVSDMD